MNENREFENVSYKDSGTAKLAHWLQHIFDPKGADTESAEGSEGAGNYHLRFYRQLPDFIVALLRQDAHATIQYAPLLYHLGMCSVCRESYLELYDALGYALSTPEIVHVPQVSRSATPIPVIALVHLCQMLITQAEAVLRLAHREQSDGQEAARSLLRMAMRMSTQITQQSERSKALHSLVDVANLAEAVNSAADQEPAAHAYTPLIGAGGTRHGNVVRGVDTALRSTGTPAEPSSIFLQAQALEGTVTQKEQMLELHLHDLDRQLRGHYVTISIPLGSLIEPVRWRGGNPRLIRSAQPVSADGTLVTPLGETELRLNDTEERNLLEVMFLLLEVRAAD